MTPDHIDELLAVNERLYKAGLKARDKPDSLDARRDFIEAQKAWRAFHPITEEKSAC